MAKRGLPHPIADIDNLQPGDVVYVATVYSIREWKPEYVTIRGYYVLDEQPMRPGGVVVGYSMRDRRGELGRLTLAATPEEAYKKLAEGSAEAFANRAEENRRTAVRLEAEASVARDAARSGLMSGVVVRLDPRHQEPLDC